MPEQADTQERTEEPTPRALERARAKGQVARSTELSGALVLLAGALFLLMFGGRFADGLRASLIGAIGDLNAGPLDVAGGAALLGGLLPQVSSMILPFLLVLLAVSLGISVAQSGGFLVVEGGIK